MYTFTVKDDNDLPLFVISNLTWEQAVAEKDKYLANRNARHKDKVKYEIKPQI